MDIQKIEKKAVAVDPAKLKQLNLAVEALEKQFGKGAIMRLGDDSAGDEGAVDFNRLHDA